MKSVDIGEGNRCVRSHGFIYNIDKFVATDDLDRLAASHCGGGKHDDYVTFYLIEFSDGGNIEGGLWCQGTREVGALTTRKAPRFQRGHNNSGGLL